MSVDRLHSVARCVRRFTASGGFVGRVVGVALVVALGCLGAVDSAWAEGTPWWGLSSGTRPSQLVPGSRGEIVALAENLGDTSTSGTLTITDRLPEGVEVRSVKGIGSGTATQGPVACSAEGPRFVTCTFGSFKNEQGKVVPEVLPAFEAIEVRIKVSVALGAESGEVNEATVSGGGAARAVRASNQLAVGGPEVFGFEKYEFTPENAGGSIDTQAGSHPFQVTNSFTLNSRETEPKEAERPFAVGLAKSLVAELPAGFIGNPTPFAQCTDKQFLTKRVEDNFEINECPSQSAIGVATFRFSDPQGGYHLVSSPIFNMVPLPGEPARFGVRALGLVSAFLDVHVRNGGNYGVTVGSSDITQITSFLGGTLTFWGVPGASVHNGQRGWECLDSGGECQLISTPNPPPFLVMPTSCEGAFASTMHGESWATPGSPSQTAAMEYRPPWGVDGCNRLPFSPEIEVTPDSSQASTSTGLNVNVLVPQQSVLNSESLAESAVRDITVTLPEGVMVNPSGGDGLAACSESEVGHVTGAESQLFTVGEAFCPNAAKIGTVEIASPLLPVGQRLKGAVYLATQNANPFGSLIAVYLVAENETDGVIFKETGETRLTPTGQLVTTVKGTPQLAFESADLHFFGGERAPLATPARCGPYTTHAVLTPWSGNQPAEAVSTFMITSGPAGSGCPGASLPFSPSLTGGTINVNAGAFTGLTTSISREDGQQDLHSVQVHIPTGIEGLLSNVKLCPEAQASSGTCGPESLIGETTVSAGVGSDPVSVTGGRVYLTEKYGNAPFGLSIVTPVKAGPFDLEHDTSNPNQQPACDCLVVRARIEVNPQSGALTVTTDSIPSFIDGIPVQIRKVNVTINREDFTFNPTNCNPMALTGLIEGGTGPIQGGESAQASFSVPFQVTNCAVLKFAPKLSVSVGGKASKNNGASLTFKIAYPKNAMGSQAWLNEAKFDLPRQLPARLSTLQQACLAATFEHDKTACPPGSKIGHATVHTPVLPVPLEGPLYFVSYGGAKFPDAVLVLQGYGITIEQHGETFINHKTGITSATFRNIPDVPFETLEVTVPEGPNSEFGANLPAKAKYNFCGQKLTMPTEFKASNGLEIHQNTALTITHCPKKVKAKATRHSRKKKR